MQTRTGGDVFGVIFPKNLGGTVPGKANVKRQLSSCRFKVRFKVHLFHTIYIKLT